LININDSTHGGGVGATGHKDALLIPSVTKSDNKDDANLYPKCGEGFTD